MTNSINKRLERLERENRIMKRAGIVVLALVLAAVLIGAATPEKIPNEIKARSFAVIDENGTIRVGISPAGIIYANENGQPRAGMNPDGIVVLDDEGEAIWRRP